MEHIHVCMKLFLYITVIMVMLLVMTIRLEREWASINVEKSVLCYRQQKDKQFLGMSTLETTTHCYPFRLLVFSIFYHEPMSMVSNQQYPTWLLWAL